MRGESHGGSPACWVFLLAASLLIRPPSAAAQWVAFIDHARGSITGTNVTAIDLYAENGAGLTNIATGQALGAGFRVTRTGTSSTGGTAVEPTAGTPAYQTFNGYIDWINSPAANNVVQLYGSLSGYTPAVYTLTLTNLDPAKRYSLKATGVRGGNYPLRWTVCSIQGAAAFTEAHTSGCLTNGDPRVPAGTITNGQVAFNSGNNLTGDLVDWEQIDPGPDGQFAVDMRQWLGAIPDGGTGGDNYGYALNAMRLEEVAGAPSIAITSPTNNATLGAPAAISITAGASGTPTPTNVEFFANGLLIGSRASSPWTVTWSNASPGSSQLLAVAWNNSGAVTSAPVNVTVVPNSPPTVAVSNPTTGTKLGTVSNIAQVAISVLATDADGVVSQVEFYGDGALLGSDSDSPYGIVWPKVPAGNHQINAVSIDNGGLRATSAPVNITVTEVGFAVQNFKANILVNTLTAAEAVLVTPSQQTAVYEETAPVLNYMNTVSEGHYTDNRAFPGLDLSTDVDDYVVEALATITIPAPGAWTFGVNSDDGFSLQIGDFSMSYPGVRGPLDTLQTFNFGAAGDYPLRLVYFEQGGGAGLELFAAQGAASAWDANFRLMGDTANGGLAVNPAPTLRTRITSPADGSVFALGGPITLTATATPGTSTVAQVAFYGPGGLIESDTTAPFSIVWSNGPLGTNSLYSVVSDTAGQSATSPVVRVVVMNPSVVLTAPANGATYMNTNPITVSVSALLPGTGTKVEFYVDGVKFAEDATAPYSAVWNSVVSGPHQLMAVGRTANWGSYTSAPVNISVLALPAGLVSWWRAEGNGTDALGQHNGSLRNGVSFVPGRLGQAFNFDGVDDFINLGGNWFTLQTFSISLWVRAGASLGTYADIMDNNHTESRSWVFQYQNLSEATTHTFQWGASGIGSIQFPLLKGVWQHVVVTLDSDRVARLYVDKVLMGSIQGTGPLNYDGTQSLRLGRWGGGGRYFTGALDEVAIFNRPLSPNEIAGIYVSGSPIVPVSITSPVEGGFFALGAPIAITASASSSTSTVTQVAFYGPAGLIGSDTTAPYSTVWSNAPLGTNSLYAVMSDTGGQILTSTVVNVVVMNPGVFLTAPANGTTFANTDPITVTAAAVLGEGTLTNMEFFVDGVKFGEDGIAPFSATWDKVVGGSHRLTVIGRSDTGTSYSSPPVNIGVATTLMAYGSVWKYLDNGSDQSTNWIAPDFDDSTWASGPAPLGYSDSNGRYPATTNSFGPDSNNKYPTTYYRQAIVVSNPAAYSGITLNLERDDGAIIYLNGAEVGRFNMNSGAVTYMDFAAGNASDDGTAVFSANLSPDWFVTGTNVLAVELHQNAGTSTDLWFQMQLIGHAVIIYNLLPTVALSSPVNNVAFLAPSSIPLESNAADADGTVAKVEFFVDGTKIGEDSTAPYSLNWSSPALGTHLILAVATDDQGAAQSSDPVTVTVYDSLGTPQVHMLSPVDGTAVEGPTNLLVTASVSAVAQVTNVQFRANGVVIGNDSTAPYSVVWASTYYSNGLVAVATDANGLSGTSAVVSVFVAKPPPRIAGQLPSSGATISSLTNISIAFTKPVQRVDAADLLINGVPATQVAAGPAGLDYVFTFPQPAYGTVSVTWAANHGITDTEPEQNPFDGARPGHSWSYTLVDQTPPAVASQNPPAGAQVTNLTQITVTFTEPVSGVNASDLLIDGLPATSVSGSGAVYTFGFAQPNATFVNISWTTAHGIRDLAVTPNAFNASAPGSTWFYLTPDTIPPRVVSLSPPADATVRTLQQIAVVFSEPVTGVSTNDLLVNSQPARQVSGSGTGPYTFTYLQPSTGPVQVRWSTTHGITDLATPPNSFAATDWTYVVDPNATYADKVVVNEILFNPPGGRVAEEWLELHNVDSDLVNLAGWRFTRGLEFTFSNVSIPAGGYLVVAADLAAFKAKYPEVTNVVGGWTGRLADNGETLELSTALGEVVNSVRYASEGDWARRERGRGASLVESITRSGSTATVTLFGHNFTASDRVMISGADQPEYNGIFVVGSPSSAAFNITVSGTPASPATGKIICRQIVDNNASGWSWFCAADGFGSSLELINPALPNKVGQNWLASITPGGTPGLANSVFRTNVAPFILDATHFPPVPRSTDSVVISARVSDQQSGGVQNVTLFYRNHSTTTPPAFSSLSMFDDGAHNDGAAQDGLYAATLAPQANGTVMEFYVQATGSTGLTRTWPAPTWETNNTFAQLANALYQVDNEAASTNMPLLRVIMAETERSQLNGIDTASDAEMNGTFVSLDGDGSQVRYNAGVRLRGAGSRGGTPKNYRVNVPNDKAWNGMTRMNLNSRYVHAQLAGSVLAQRAGLPCADARVVQMRVNGQNLASSSISFGSYVLVEPMNGDWAANHFPLDPDGNAYRGSKYPWTANLDYLGTNAATYQGQTGAGYYKTSNRDENDWTDLFRLTYALSPNVSDVDYVTAVRTNVNVEEWLLYFMVCNFFDYQETSLCIGVGDDYAMYRGMVDPRFRLVAHDFDTSLGQGDAAGSTNRSIWHMLDMSRTTDPSMVANFLSRFMRHPEFAPIYFRLWREHLENTFTPEQVNPLLDEVLGGWVTGNTIPNMKAFVAGRRAYVLSQITTNLTVATTLGTQNGYLYTTSPNVTLNGQVHIIDTRRVLVNGSAATWSAWQGRWTNTVTLQPGINRVLVQSLDSNHVEFARATVDIWYDDGSVQTVTGPITTDTTWSAAQGPYQLTANLTVNSGTTLTIQPGTTVYLGSGVNLTVANGGQLLAEGMETAAIRFTRPPGTSANWGGITINGGAGSPETRIAYAHLEFNGSTAIHSTDGTVFMDHLTFGNTAVQYLSLDRSSFVVQDCVFPASTASFEPVHGTGGIKAGGRGLFLRNFFGPHTGYNDTIDFTGGHRPGPIVQFINNVFMGSGDDNLDLDNTDAWVEGNIFMHVHKNGSPDTSSAVSGGSDTGESSDVTIMGNIFYDCDHVALAKQGNYFSFINNTIVKQSHTGGLDTEGAVMVLADNGMTEGAGAYFEGNILSDIEQLTQHWTNAIVTFTNNLMPLAWSGPGGNHSTAAPLLAYVPQLAETTNFTNWAQAQVLKKWFALQTGSLGIGTGPNGRDKGGVVPFGVSITGEPVSPISQTSAALTVGVNRAANGMTTTRWPNGSGFTHYKWRLDAGVWSTETPINTPITLTGLSVGPHFMEVVGKNDAGFYQDDPVFGADASITVSRSWFVNPAASPLRLNELLASNGGALNHEGTSPDAVELYNASDAAMDLTGVRLTDEQGNPDKFIFPAGASIPARSYLVVYANNGDGTSGYHLGFKLDQGGDSLYLFASTTKGGALLDSISFGPQLTDLSIGRLADGSWALTVPTLGGPNQAAAVGDPATLRINEWLAISGTPIDYEFIELYNTGSLPVALGGLYLSDEILGWRDRQPIPALSFIAGYGYTRFFADGDPAQGPEHLNFGLSGDQGAIGLYRPDLTPIDQVHYPAQWANVSQGRSPNGGNAIVFFEQPTPGAPNPVVTTTPPGVVVPLLGALDSWRYDQSGADLGTAWSGPAYNDSAWASGRGVLAVEDCACLPYPINTVLSLTNGPTRVITYYFRTTFVAPTNGTLASLQLSHVIDDGAIFYLNGQELLRINMPSGTVTSTTLAVAVGDATLQGPFAVSAAALQPGTNVLAVEVHQNNATSTDIVFGLGLDALIVTNAPPAGSVVLNEVLAANASITEANGATPDWVELYNQSAGQVDLSGLSLTDDTLQARRWVFPNGTQIAPHGYCRVFFDASQPASTNNSGFGLKSTGGSLYLFDTPANGGGLLSAVTYGFQVADLSIGRVPDGGTNWFLCGPTPATANQTVASLGDPTKLMINEWMADPGPGKDDWFELYNPEPQPVALGGLYLTDDLNDRTAHKIAALSFVGAGSNAWQKFVADGNIGAGADHVRFGLSRGGEALGLFDTNGTLINGLTFGAQQPGVSQGRFPDGATNIVAFPGTDSPGASNWRRLTNIVINEALTHSLPPLEDAIELHNLSDQPLDIGGWWLSDDEGTLQKYQIPLSTVVPAHGFVVVYANVFTNRDTTAIPFALSAEGDQVVLSAFTNNVFTGWRTRVDFGPAAIGVSFGRYVTSDSRNEFVAMSARTFGMDNPATVEQFRSGTGATNAYPQIGPVVISEIMYHPPDLGTNDNTRDEFIELRNISTAPVAFFEGTNGWHLRDGVDFDFAPGTVLPPGGSLLVVGFDPVNNLTALGDFRSTYSLGTSIPVVGPWIGKLANDHDDIELRRPDVTGTNVVPYILVERVHYYDAAPWPALADGTGSSLQRRTLNEYGNDPVNWSGATPTPGSAGASIDSDGDGMPDSWETENGLDPQNPADAALDPDGDELSNLLEYQLGTDPHNSASGLRLAITSLPGTTNLMISFTAVSNMVYSLEYNQSLSTTWQTLQAFPASPSNQLIQVMVAPVSLRFYRLRLGEAASGSLQINAIQPMPGNRVMLQLGVPANQSCTLLYSPMVANGTWVTVTNFAAAPTNSLLQVVAPTGGTRGFYRLRSQ